MLWKTKFTPRKFLKGVIELNILYQMPSAVKAAPAIVAQFKQKFLLSII